MRMRMRDSTDSVGCRWVCKVEYLDVPLSATDDHEWVHDIHRITPLWEVDGRNRVRCTKVPVLKAV